MWSHYVPVSAFAPIVPKCEYASADRDVSACMCKCLCVCAFAICASVIFSCKMMSSLMQRPKKCCEQSRLSKSPAYRSRTQTDAHACNSSRHICTQPLSSTNRHFASSLWQGQCPIRIVAERLCLFSSSIQHYFFISLYINAIFMVNLCDIVLLSAGLYCWHVLVFHGVSFRPWPAQYTVPAVTGGCRFTVLNEAVLVASNDM